MSLKKKTSIKLFFVPLAHSSFTKCLSLFISLLFLSTPGHANTGLLPSPEDRNMQTISADNYLLKLSPQDNAILQELLQRSIKETGINIKLVHSGTTRINETTPLYLAVHHNHIDLTKKLLAAGADPNITVAEGAAPIHAAARYGYVDALNALLAANADVNGVNHDGETPLLVAAEIGHCSVVQALLAANADVNSTRQEDGATPLMMAAYHGHLDVVQALLAANADVNRVSKEGITALFMAAFYGHVEIVEACLAAHANTNVRWDGMTPIQAARQQGHIKVVEILMRISELPGDHAS